MIEHWKFNGGEVKEPLPLQSLNLTIPLLGDQVQPFPQDLPIPTISHHIYYHSWKWATFPGSPA